MTANTRKLIIARALDSSRHNVTTESNRVLVTIGKRGPSVYFYEDGTMHRGDVDLTIARRMTVTEAAKVLGLASAA